MDQMVNDIRLAIKTALEAGEPPLQVQLKVKEVADLLNNPEYFLHLPKVEEPPPEVEP